MRLFQLCSRYIVGCAQWTCRSMGSVLSWDQFDESCLLSSLRLASKSSISVLVGLHRPSRADWIASQQSSYCCQSVRVRSAGDRPSGCGVLCVFLIRLFVVGEHAMTNNGYNLSWHRVQVSAFEIHIEVVLMHVLQDLMYVLRFF